MDTSSTPIAHTTSPRTTALPVSLPLASAPVSRAARVPVRLVFGAERVQQVLASATTPHPRTGRTAYDLLPGGDGLVVWSTPSVGWWDPTVDHVGTILFDTADVLWRGDRGDAVVSGLLVCPPYSLADLLAHVRALFGEPLRAALLPSGPVA
jgi:hypothetical protein